MAWRRPGDEPLYEPMMVSLLTNIYMSLHLNELRHFCENDLKNLFQKFWIAISYSKTCVRTFSLIVY